MTAVIKKAGYEAIWATVRKLVSFTREDLCVELGKEFGNRVNEHTVKSYLQRLTLAGHLSSTDEPIGNGTAVRHHYTLIKDTGVVAPRLNDDGQPNERGGRGGGGRGGGGSRGGGRSGGRGNRWRDTVSVKRTERRWGAVAR